MAKKKGHKRMAFNIPEEEVVVLKERAEATESNMAAVINADILSGNTAFKDTQKD